MNKVLDRRELAPGVTMLEVHSPHVERRWKAGQFVILRPREESERIPLTIVGSSEERRSITLVVQVVGHTSGQTAGMQPGEHVVSVAGPLGEPAPICEGRRVVCVGGGVGVAELLPVARAYRDKGNEVTVICGARTDGLRILDAELRESAGRVEWATDDGSAGYHGNVVGLLESVAGPGDFDEGHVIGPIPMMKAVAEATRGWGMMLHASLNPVMIDGTGMCGGCRVSVKGEVKFACVDGPGFDAYHVDFDELARRNRAYKEHEKLVREHHSCRVGLDVY